MLGMKNHFDISGSIEIREVDIARVACIWTNGLSVKQKIWKTDLLHLNLMWKMQTMKLFSDYEFSVQAFSKTEKK